jgi:hypothetical protein
MIERVCEEIEACLAAGEIDDDLRLHLTTCASCAALARDVERLRRAATALPRPPLAATTVTTRRRRWGVISVASAATVIAALVIGPAVLRRRHSPDAENVAIDLLTLFDEAHQLWAPPTTQKPFDWLKYTTDTTDTTDDGWSVIDPTAPLSATALLLDKTPRGGPEATAVPTGDNQTRRRQ